MPIEAAPEELNTEKNKNQRSNTPTVFGAREYDHQYPINKFAVKKSAQQANVQQDFIKLENYQRYQSETKTNQKMPELEQSPITSSNMQPNGHHRPRTSRHLDESPLPTTERILSSFKK